MKSNQFSMNKRMLVKKKRKELKEELGKLEKEKECDNKILKSFEEKNSQMIKFSKTIQEDLYLKIKKMKDQNNN